MENYTGKVCPFCKTEIKEEDSVKVCPACNIPHHEACWEENKGCTTFGCSEQHVEDAASTPAAVCSKCGAALEEGQVFCSKCGQKADLIVDAEVNSAINQFNAEVSNSIAAKNKSPLVPVIAAVAAVVVIAIGIFVAPKIFVSVEDLCARGDYAKAYEKADEDEKLEVIAENVAAVQSAFSAENLKDPDSFQLRNAYYKEGTTEAGDPSKQLVLYISGANSYGAKVSSYWLYTWDNDEQDWSYFCSVSDLTEEEYNTYDDSEERIEKLLNNIGRLSIKKTMQDGIELDKDAVKRINTMFEEDRLEDVELIDVE